MRSLFRGDDNHTVGTTGTVDGCGRYIFQHLDALDVGRIQKGQRVERRITARGSRTCRCGIVIDNETINHVQRLIATRDGVTTTDADDACCTRLARGLRHVQACHGTLKGTLYRGVGLAEQFTAYG